MEFLFWFSWKKQDERIMIDLSDYISLIANSEEILKEYYVYKENFKFAHYKTIGFIEIDDLINIYSRCVDQYISSIESLILIDLKTFVHS